MNFYLWEKIILFFFKHNKNESIVRFCKEAFSNIGEISIGNSFFDDKNIYLLSNKEENCVRETLINYLSSVLQRTFSLKSNNEINNLIKDIDSLFNKENLFKNLRKTPTVNASLFNNSYKLAYIKSFMVNTAIIPSPLCDYSNLKFNEYDLFSIKSLPKRDGKTTYDYLNFYPRYIHFHEIYLLLLRYPHIPNTKAMRKKSFEASKENIKSLWDLFWKVNYGRKKYVNSNPIEIREFGVGKPNIIIQVGENFHREIIRIGVANVRVSEDKFENNLRGTSSFSNDTRKNASRIINAAINEKVDLLVLPECYIHYSWLGKLIRVAKDHQMCMVFGLEHVIRNKIASNYIVTLLPFKLGEFTNCFLDIRLKNHYSPSEERAIKGHYLKIPKTNHKYNMYNWKGLSFTSYCCNEISSIEDRAIFKSLIDVFVVVEWNKDVEYFSNIIESLCRDLHCYCIQVNSSNFGDNRISQPAHGYLRDIIQAKGGVNDYLVVGEINVEELRMFQKRSHDLQKDYENDHGKFKPTPPDFNQDAVDRR